MTEDLKIEMLEISKLTPYEKNARAHGESDVDIIAASIKELGFNDPVGVWGPQNIIVEGHGRVLAAKKLKLKKIPCVRLDRLTDKQRREYAIVHNKTAEFSMWDFDKMADELAAVDMEKYGVNFIMPTAFSDEEIDALFVDAEPKRKKVTCPFCKTEFYVDEAEGKE